MQDMRPRVPVPVPRPQVPPEEQPQDHAGPVRGAVSWQGRVARWYLKQHFSQEKIGVLKLIWKFQIIYILQFSFDFLVVKFEWKMILRPHKRVSKFRILCVSLCVCAVCLCFGISFSLFACVTAGFFVSMSLCRLVFLPRFYGQFVLVFK